MRAFLLQCARPANAVYDIYVVTSPPRRKQGGGGSNEADDQEMADLLADLEDDLRIDETGSTPTAAASSSSSSAPAGATAGAAAAPPLTRSGTAALHETRVAELSVQALVDSARSSVKKDIRDRLAGARQATTACTVALTQGSSQSGSQHVEDEKKLNDEARQLLQTTRYVMTFDGEHFHLQAMLRIGTESDKDKERYKSLEKFKLPAMCSAFTQPNDKMAGFRVVKAMQRQTNGQTQLFHVVDERSLYFTNCESIVAGIADAASRRTFLKFLQHLPRFLSTAYTVDNITKGWAMTGLWPRDNSKMLEYWPKYGELTRDQCEGILQAIEDLSPVFAAQGYIPDAQILEKIDPHLPEDCYVRERAKILQDYALNQWRATWLNAEGTIARINKRKADRDKEESDKAARKRGKAAVSTASGAAARGSTAARSGGATSSTSYTNTNQFRGPPTSAAAVRALLQVAQPDGAAPLADGGPGLLPASHQARARGPVGASRGSGGGEQEAAPVRSTSAAATVGPSNASSSGSKSSGPGLGGVASRAITSKYGLRAEESVRKRKLDED
jgi:hypothetical protein